MNYYDKILLESNIELYANRLDMAICILESYGITIPEDNYETVEEMRLETRLNKPYLPDEFVAYRGVSKYKGMNKPVEPNYFNPGSRLSEPRLSSFWTDKEITALRYAIGYTLQPFIDKWNNVLSKKYGSMGVRFIEYIVAPYNDPNDSGKPKVCICCKRSVVSALLSFKDPVEMIISYLKSHPIYVYRTTFKKEDVGVGHSMFVSTITVDKPVTDYELLKLRWNDYSDKVVFIESNSDIDTGIKAAKTMLPMRNGKLAPLLFRSYAANSVIQRVNEEDVRLNAMLNNHKD